MNLYRWIDRSRLQFDFLYFTDRVCHYDSEIQALGGIIYRLPPVNNPASRFWSTFQFLRAHPEFVAVHNHTLLDGGLYLLAAYFGSVSSRIAHSHTTRANLRLSAFSLLYQRISIKLMQWCANRYVACGHAAGQFLFGPSRPFHIMRNGIALTRFAASSPSLLRSLLNLPADCRVLCQIGRLDYQKNPGYSLSIARKLTQMGYHYHLVFVGDGQMIGDLEDTVVTFGLEKHVSFLGNRNDIPDILAGSDLMLLPSFYEGFPLVLVESQAAGLPAVVSNQVSEEVDLGLGLIEFLPLVSVDQWCKTIIKFASATSPSRDDRIAVLEKAGFDAASNAARLNELYGLPR